jgi:phospholipase C
MMQDMPSPSGPIEHIVVLMMENRSFDHMLGYLPREGHLKNLEGLTGKEFNLVDPLADPTDPKVKKFFVSPTAKFELESSVVGVGPPHAFPDVNIQLTNNKDGPSATVPVRNNGFVRAWIESLRAYAKDKNLYGWTDDKNLYGDTEDNPYPLYHPDDPQRVMGCFAPKDLPILTKLAQNFVLCDHWFCSVPGPTMPNRLYVHAATSCGYAHNDFGQHFSCRTIYNSLEESGYTWSVYTQNLDIVNNFTGLNHVRKDSKEPNFRDYRSFFEKDIAQGKLAHYSFINPRFIDQWNDLTNGFERVSSQHAPCDVRPGEILIAEVYNALRRNEDVWKKTLLVILYDEHGGFYDHVPPPTEVSKRDGTVSPVLNPDGLDSKDPPFDFTRLGLRTPAILISPLLPKKLDSTVYEHSSLLATVKKLFNLKSFLTERDRRANSFEHLFDGAQFRDDTLAPFSKDEIPKMPTIFPRLEDMPMDEVQIEIMRAAIPLLLEEQAKEATALLGPPCKMTRRQAADFQNSAIQRFSERIMENDGRHPLA